MQKCKNFKYHVIPKSHDPIWDEDNKLATRESFHHDVYLRSTNCELLFSPPASDAESCKSCTAVFSAQIKTQNTIRKGLVTVTPAKLKAPISKTSPERIKLGIQEQRLKCAKLEKELEIEIEKASVKVDDQMSNDVVSILSNVNSKEMTPFVQLFWQQQKKCYKQVLKEFVTIQ